MFKNLIFFSILILFALGAQAQGVGKPASQYLFKGVLVDADSAVHVSFAHIRNYYKNTVIVANQEGAFIMPVQGGDTLLISRIGYTTLKYAVPKKEPQGVSTIFLQPKTEELQEVVITKFPTEARFKEQLLGVELPEEKGIALNLPPAPPYSDPNSAGGVTLLSKNGLITGFANKFNDKERGRQFKIRMENKETQDAFIATKFNKSIAQKITGLKDEHELNEFMKFCVLPEDFLYKANEYQIHEAVMGCFKEFVASR